MEKTLGQVAYEAWASRVIPARDIAWSILPDSAHTGWEEIAKEVITHASNQPTARIEIPAPMKLLFD